MAVMADTIGAKTVCLNLRQNGLYDVLGFDASPNTIDELLSTNYIVRVGFRPEDSRVIDLKCKQAVEAGAKMVDIDEDELLKGFAKAVLDSGKGQDLAGYAEFAAYLDDVRYIVECIKEAIS